VTIGRFTDRGRRVVVLAQEEAGRFGHDHVGAGHPLLGPEILDRIDSIERRLSVLEHRVGAAGTVSTRRTAAWRPRAARARSRATARGFHRGAGRDTPGPFGK
jgi:hypothetical protein